MNHASTPPLDTEYLYLSSMSEVDSLSDSDWLDISSNRESDDNDSVSSRDSDHDEGGSVPPSRRSSMSIGSSRDGDVEAWEGFADDSADEGTPNSYPIYPILSAADDAEPDAAAQLSDIERDIAEEQRVKDALDQSMIGTLSASRSSSLAGHSSTVHSSLRDLRLSFPDPLTSSRDELIRSYEDVSPSETTSATNDEDAVSPCDTSSPKPDGDPGSFTTPEVPHYQTQANDSYLHADLDIMLYGSASVIKWAFVHDLIQKEAIGSNRTLTNTSQFVNGSTRWLHLDRSTSEFAKLVDTIAIHDRTEGNLEQLEAPRSRGYPDRPSLAVVYLPSSSPPSLSEHTFYLPVFVPSPSFVDSLGFDDAAAHKSAQDMWNLLAIPTSKTMRLCEDGVSCLFDSQDLRLLKPLHVHHEFQRIAVQTKERQAKVFSHQFTSVHAVALFALMSLMLGFAIDSALRTPTPVSTPAAGMNNFWGIFGPAIHQSTIVPPSVANTNVAVIPSSLKDFALAVLNPSTTSSSYSPHVHPSTGCGAGITKSSECECKLMTWSERVKSSKDLILRPGPSVLSVDIPLKARIRIASAAGKIVGIRGESSSSLSIKLVDSLSEIAYTTMKALVEVVRDDLEELMEALDELMRAIGHQTSAIMEQSKGTVQVLREHLRYRNNKARGKARELKEMGGQLVSLAGEQLRGRACTAKKRAQTLKENLVTTKAWRTYRKAHGEWAVKLNRDRRNERIKQDKSGIKGERKGGTARPFSYA